MTISLDPGTHSIGTFAMVFDNRTTASEVWLIGGYGTTLEFSSNDSAEFPLLIVCRGAPVIHLIGLHLVGTLRAEGSRIVLEECTIEAATGARRSRRQLFDDVPRAAALTVLGGEARLRQTTFAGHRGGAIAVTSGGVTLNDCLLAHNHAARGGALHVIGGRVHISNCVFEQNRALTSGGALQVGGKGRE